MQKDIQKRQYRKKATTDKIHHPREMMITQEAPGIDNGEIRE